MCGIPAGLRKGTVVDSVWICKDRGGLPDQTTLGDARGTTKKRPRGELPRGLPYITAMAVTR